MDVKSDDTEYSSSDNNNRFYRTIQGRLRKRDGYKKHKRIL